MCRLINPGPPAPRAAQARRFFSHCRVRFYSSPYNTMLSRRGDTHAAALRSITLESFALNAYRLHCAVRGKKQLPLLSQSVTLTGSTTDDALGKTTFDGISATRGNATQRVNTTNIAKKRIRLRLRLIAVFLSEFRKPGLPAKNSPRGRPDRITSNPTGEILIDISPQNSQLLSNQFLKATSPSTDNGKSHPCNQN